MPLDEKDVTAISEAVTAVLSEHVLPATHKKHHDYIELKIEEDINRKEMIRKIKTQLAIIGITGATGTILAMMYYATTHGYGVN